MNTLKVTVDKSHIVTIGEKLYGESVELIRELVNNAYDADATEVKVTITDDSIIVQDNGSGMDIESVPVMDPDFDVILNGINLLPKRHQGHQIPVLEGTPFGMIHGELVILPASSASTLDLGIDVKVKKVTIKRELFGMET